MNTWNPYFTKVLFLKASSSADICKCSQSNILHPIRAKFFEQATFALHRFAVMLR